MQGMFGNEKGLRIETNRRRYTGQLPGTKSGLRPADKLRINRLSIGYQPVVKRSLSSYIGLHRISVVPVRCVPPSVYIGFRSFVLLKRHSGQLFSMSWTARGSAVSWANRPVGVPSCPAPPCPAATPCAALPRLARGTYVRVLDSTGRSRNKARG